MALVDQREQLFEKLKEKNKTFQTAEHDLNEAWNKNRFPPMEYFGKWPKFERVPTPKKPRAKSTLVKPESTYPPEPKKAFEPKQPASIAVPKRPPVEVMKKQPTGRECHRRFQKSCSILISSEK